MIDARIDGLKVAVWQRVCTAEHKMKKPRPLSHSPLGAKLHGVLHSTHKQPAGNVWEKQADDRRVGWKQELGFYMMSPSNRQTLPRQEMEI